MLEIAYDAHVNSILKVSFTIFMLKFNKKMFLNRLISKFNLITGSLKSDNLQTCRTVKNTRKFKLALFLIDLRNTDILRFPNFSHFCEFVHFYMTSSWGVSIYR